MNKNFIATIVVTILIVTNTSAQLIAESGVRIKPSTSTPATVWLGTTNPVLAAFGEGASGNADQNLMMASGTATARGVFLIKRSRGTLAAPAVVQTNDQLGSMLASGYDGTNFINAAALDFYADGTPTAGNVPIRLSLVTGTNSTNRTERLKISSTGDFTFNKTQMYFKATGGRLGLGTAAPGGQLELSLDQARKPGTSTWTITSDARLKNIEGAYKKGLKDILKLKPISYHYKNDPQRNFDENTLKTRQVGFSAQDVKEIFPEAVGTDEDGYLNFNIHPILIASVNAFKDVQSQLDEKDKTIAKLQEQLTTQQATIDLLMNKFSELDSKLANVSNPVNQDVSLSIKSVNSLGQNSPNPTTNTTIIKYHLTNATKTGQLIIADSKGSVIKAINLAISNEGQVTLSAGSLSNGTYYYTLYADGQQIDTKKMQIVR